MSKDNFLMKDSINLKVISLLAVNIKNNYKNFDDKNFLKSINKKLKTLELKERINFVTQSLHIYLPSDYKTSLSILLKSLPEELPNHSKETDGYGADRLDSLHGFIMISITNYVSSYGLGEFKLSMDALNIMTRMFSAEEAARYFIQSNQKKTLSLFKKWCKHQNIHVRRLVSESTRPRLPWAMQLPEFVQDPAPIMPLLEALKSDPELYVRRSVANNLNDISKDNPKLVIRTLKEWNKNPSPEMQWLIKHALRTLIKQGNTQALAILGFKKNPKIKVSGINLKSKEILFEEFLSLSTKITSTSKKDQWLMIDYIIHHMKANKTLTPKVFKLKKVNLRPDEELIIDKKHHFKEITTRKYYSGRHEVQLQVNGVLFPKVSFELKK